MTPESWNAAFGTNAGAGNNSDMDFQETLVDQNASQLKANVLEYPEKFLALGAEQAQQDVSF
uniref:Uncharacterized protein n=1 Tax=Romanomermis culicivorax TaxID=13658 RepID=A0A915JQ99_ROMCU